MRQTPQVHQVQEKTIPIPLTQPQILVRRKMKLHQGITQVVGARGHYGKIVQSAVVDVGQHSDTEHAMATLNVGMLL